MQIIFLENCHGGDKTQFDNEKIIMMRSLNLKPPKKTENENFANSACTFFSGEKVAV